MKNLLLEVQIYYNYKCISHNERLSHMLYLIHTNHIYIYQHDVHTHINIHLEEENTFFKC